MCLWNRPERLEAIIRGLASQDVDGGLRLVLWNNRRANLRTYHRVLDDLAVTGALRSIELVQSPLNIGGIGRFVVMRDLRRHGYTGPVVTLDDDQDVSPDFITTLRERATPRSVVGVWAFRYNGGYWKREAAEDHGAADYIGTGGAIFDSEIVDLPGFFSDLPRRYLMVEDMWASAMAKDAGWRLEKADIGFVFVEDGRNQFTSMLRVKQEFYSYLTQRAAQQPRRSRSGR